MTPGELHEEITINLELLTQTIQELVALQRDVAGREATTRERTAAAAFMAQFYGGVENILKRICRYHGISLPTGDKWHLDLFKRFCDPSHKSLPMLFDKSLELPMAAFRKFRHVAYHSYGLQLDWNRMLEGIAMIQNVFQQFNSNLSEYLKGLETTGEE